MRKLKSLNERAKVYAGRKLSSEQMEALREAGEIVFSERKGKFLVNGVFRASEEGFEFIQDEIFTGSRYFGVNLEGGHLDETRSSRYNHLGELCEDSRIIYGDPVRSIITVYDTPGSWRGRRIDR